MSEAKPNARELLTRLGIGQFNATMIIPYMFIQPMTTDPKSSQTILMVEHLQRKLYELGATDVPLSGRLDEPTARALAQIVGPDWARTTWAGNISKVLEAKASGVSLRAPPGADMEMGGQPIAVGGTFDFLPDVPGGMLTYAVAGYFLYRYFKGRKARR